MFVRVVFSFVATKLRRKPLNIQLLALGIYFLIIITIYKPLIINFLTKK
jgi:hypothetical protein